MQMKLILTAVMFFLMLPIANAQNPSPDTHVYFIEYKKAIKGTGDVETLNIIFFVKVDSQKAETILREELNRVVNSFAPKNDVLATAWFSPTGTYVDEQQITLVDGSTELIFSKRENKILTGQEMWKRK